MQQTLFWELFIFHVNRAEAALLGAGAALEAFALVNLKRLFDLTLRCVCRADPTAQGAAFALFGDDGHFFYLAPACRRGDCAVRADVAALPAFNADFFVNCIAAFDVVGWGDRFIQTDICARAAADTLVFV